MKIARFNPEPHAFPRPRISPLPDGPLPPARAWLRPANPISTDQNFRHFTRGRYALHAAYQLSGVGKKGALLAPAYHCVTMLDPALALGADIQLYPLRPDLSPALEQLDAIVAQAKAPVAALLATHYFGFGQHFTALRQWCDERGIVLIEDCSHVLFGERYRAAGAGLHGRFVVASPYKFFPVPDGGLLYARDAHLLDGVTTNPAGLKDELRGAKACLENRFGRPFKPGPTQTIETHETPPDDDQILERPTPSSLYATASENTASLHLSRLLTRRAAIDDNIAQRRNNYGRWSESVAALPHCRALYPDLPADTVPYMFPLVIDHPSPHFDRLKHLGVPIWRWDEMALSDCPVAKDYRLHLLHLPCHQGLSESQMDWMIAALEQTLRNEIPAVAGSEPDAQAFAVQAPPSPARTAQPNRVRSYESVGALRAVHENGIEFSARDNIETSIDWFDLLQQNVYPNDEGVRYYVVAENGRPSTILPLRLVTSGRVRSIEALSNYYTSLYAPLGAKSSDPLALQSALAAAVREHAGAHVMRFAPMDPECADYKQLMNAIRALGWIPFRFFCFGNWFLRVSGDWADYLNKRSANLRSSIKRRNKSFATDAGTLEVVTGVDIVEQAVAAFQDVYLASWKIPEPYPEFVPSLIRRLAALGMLRLGIARLRGRAIAAQLWIVGENKASIYKVAYNEAFSGYSPGTILTGFLMRHVIEQDHVKEVDFLIGDDKYKQIWMSDRRERWGIVAYNPRTITGLALLLKEMAGRLSKSAGIKAHDAFQQSCRTGISWEAKIQAVLRPHAAKHSLRPKMTWTILPVTELASNAQQWDALVRLRPGTAFLESAFLQPVTEIFGHGEERLCLLHVNGQLRAAAIMQRRRTGVWQTFQPSQLPLGAWVSGEGVDFIAACQELREALPGFNLSIGISQLDSRIHPRLPDGSRVRSQNYIQTSWVDIEGSFADYWEARGKNLKQNTRKQRNKLQAEGIETRIECLTAPEDVAKAIEDYGSLESAGWKAADGTAILPDNDQGRFYRKMLENYCSLGRGRIYRYSFGEKVVAMDLCIHDDVTLVILKTAYDESYKSVSPSTLMRQDQFQQLFEERKFARIEFYGKIMEWHTRWTTQNRALFHLTAYRWPWLKQAHARLSQLLAPKPAAGEAQPSPSEALTS